MFGTVVNSLAIIAGGLVGLLFSRRMPEKYKEILLIAVGLTVVLIGIKSALASGDLMVVLLCMTLGGLLGEALAIEKKFEDLGSWLERKFSSASKDQASFSRGFVSTSLICCVGSLGIVGALESGLTGNHQTLLAKSVLDFVTGIVFASTMGLGVLFASISVFIYQGAITLGAVFIKDLLVPETIAQMTSVGGLLIMAMGLNMLKISNIRVPNLIPAVFMPLAYLAIKPLF